MRRSIFHFVAVLLIGVSALSGQALNTKGLEDSLQDFSKPPIDRVVDFGEIFGVDGSSRAKLSGRLEALNQRYQFSVYYVAYSGIIGSNVGEKAAEFRDSWLGSEEEGLIFVCDTDMKTIAYALTKVDGLPIDGGIHPWKLPDHEVIQAMIEISNVDSSGMNEEEYLSSVGHHLIDELEARLESEQESTTKGPGGVLGTVVAVAGLVGLGVWWVRRKAGVVLEEVGRSDFPAIEIPNRLGAHFGGGSVCEISFQPPSSSLDS